MAMTEAVKDELGRLSITKPCCRKAEVSALVRFAGGLHVVAGRIVVEVELDAAQSARRLKKDIADNQKELEHYENLQNWVNKEIAELKKVNELKWMYQSRSYLDKVYSFENNYMDLYVMRN